MFCVVVFDIISPFVVATVFLLEKSIGTNPFLVFVLQPSSADFCLVRSLDLNVLNGV